MNLKTDPTFRGFAAPDSGTRPRVPNQRQSLLATAMAAATLMSSAAFGADIFWDGTNATDSDWALATNWVGGVVPGVADIAFINDITNFSPELTADTTVDQVLVSRNGLDGQLDVTSGTLTTNQWMVVGHQTNGDGTLNITGSGAVAANATNGNFQIAELAGSSGIVTVDTSATTGLSTRELVVGNGGDGTLNVASSAVVASGANRIATNASGSHGTVNLTGGSITVSDFARWGAVANAVAEVNVGAGTTFDINCATSNTEALRIGEGSPSQSTVNIDGELRLNNTANRVLRIGHNSNTTVGTNIVNVNSGGRLYQEGDVLLGFSGGAGSTSLLNIDGGTMDVGSATTRWFMIGQWDAQQTTIDIKNGGTLNLNAGTDVKVSNQNDAGTLTGTHKINIDGVGSVLNGTVLGGNGSDIQIPRYNSAGTFEINITNGGQANLQAIYTNANNPSTKINFDNGTLKALGNDANWIRLNGVGTREVNLLAGGGTFDTAGFNCTIGNNVQGVGDLTKAGAGTLTLGGGATYTGQTNINGGLLVMGGTPTTSGVAVGAAGTLGIEETGNTQGSLTLGNATFATGASVNIEVVTSGSTSEKLVVTDLDTSAGGVQLNLFIDGGSLQALPGTYEVINYSGTWTGSPADIVPANLRSGYTYNIVDTSGVVTIEVTGVDTDSDGLDDGWEIANFTDLSQGPNDNPDGDFSSNLEEFLNGTDPTDPNSDPDNTDVDGLPDSYEIANFGDLDEDENGDFDSDLDNNGSEYAAVPNGTTANDADIFVDTDSDGMGDGWETLQFTDLSQDGTADTDSDGFTDLLEFKAKSDPNVTAYSPSLALLAHRWSFTNNLADTGDVGGSPAVIQPGDTNSDNPVVLNATNVTFTGGAKANSEWVQLGSGLLPDNLEPVTLEFWATETGNQNWSRLFSIHQAGDPVDTLFMAWQRGGTVGTDRVEWTKPTGTLGGVSDTMAFALGTQYHIVMTIEPTPTNADRTTVTWYASAVSNPGVAKGSFDANGRINTINDAIIALGRSRWGDNAPAAIYDEARLFFGKLDELQMEALHDQGPDDATQVDSDSDGLADAWENYWLFGLTDGPLDDTDSDGYSNAAELVAMSDPFDPAYTPDDSDGDGLPDEWELENFGNLDQDGLGDPDGDEDDNATEYAASTDPNDHLSNTDLDSDGISDNWEFFVLGYDAVGTEDDDGDGFDALAEFTALGDPFDPISPGAPDGDGDNDGLPDRWEVDNFTLDYALEDILVNVGPGDDPDSDGDTNLEEYKATSDPNDDQSTVTDINADGLTDNLLWNDQDATGSGILDKDSEATMFTDRLANSGTTIPSPDPNLDLDTSGSGTLSITTGGADLNGQVGVAGLEAIGIPLTDVSFVQNQDFRIRAHFVDMPAMGGIDQCGAYVGTATNAMTRVATFGGNYQALGVNNNGGGDSGGAFTTLNATGEAQDMTVIIERIDGVWAMSVNGNACTPTQPTFLDGTDTLQVGVWGTNGGTTYTANLESFTVVTFGTTDTDGDGLEDDWEIANFGNLDQTGTDDPDSDCAINEWEETEATDPNVDTSWPDINGDGVNDGHRLIAIDAIGTSSMDTDTVNHWDDGLDAMAGCNYLVYGSPSGVANQGLRTPESGDTTFAGDKLIMSNDGTFDSSLVVKSNGITTIPYFGLDGVTINQAVSSNTEATLAGTEFNVSATSTIWANNSSFVITAPLTGSAQLDLTGGNLVTLSGTNTFTGDINVTNTAGLALSNTGGLTFVISTPGANNAIIGTGPVSLDGTLSLDTTLATTNPGDAWNLVTSTGALTIGANFAVSGFTPDAGAVGERIWTDGTYQFIEEFGILVVPGGDTDSDGLDDEWEYANFGDLSQDGTGDPDSDGFDNAAEFAGGSDPNDAGSTPGPAVPISVGAVSFDTATNTYSITVNGLVNGQQYHFESSLDLGGFSAVVGSTWTAAGASETRNLVADEVANPKQFFRAVDGAEPAP